MINMNEKSIILSKNMKFFFKKMLFTKKDTKIIFKPIIKAKILCLGGEGNFPGWGS